MLVASLRPMTLAALLFTSAAFAQQSGGLKLTGDLPHPSTLSVAELAAMPAETAMLPEHDTAPVSYEGVSLRALLANAGAPFGHDLRGPALASYVVAKAQDGYQVVFTLAELDQDFGNERIIVAHKRAGQPLSEKDGPLRLIVPGDKRAARCVRMLQEVQFVRLPK
jgi:hypothetical protein